MTIDELLIQLKANSAKDVEIQTDGDQAISSKHRRAFDYEARCGGIRVGISHDLAVILRRRGARTNVPALLTIDPD